MTPLSDTSIRNNKFDNPLNVKVTSEMLYHIQTGAEKKKVSVSEFIREILYLGIKSIEEV